RGWERGGAGPAAGRKPRARPRPAVQVDAAFIPPPQPPLPPELEDLTPEQKYFLPAPLGIDVNYVQDNYWNGTGGSWGLTDVEFGWNRNHRELTTLAGPGGL